MESKSIDRQGARVAYEVRGDGPAILGGHRAPCERRMWRGVAPRPARIRRVINVDPRGHGASTAPGPSSLVDLADERRTLLDEQPEAVLRVLEDLLAERPW